MGQTIPARSDECRFSGGVMKDGRWIDTIKDHVPGRASQPLVIVTDFSRFTGVIKGGGWVVTVNEGEEVHFKVDKRDFVVRQGQLVALDGSLGGTTAPAAPSTSAKVEQARTALITARASIDAAIAALR